MKIKISKHNQDLAKFQFVNLARDAKSLCTGFKYISIQNREACCTDGHRMHIAHLAGEFEDGLYEVMKATKTELVLLKSSEPLTSFLDYNRCLIKPKEESIAAAPTCEAYAALVRAMNHEATLNYDYFKDAASACDRVYPEAATKLSPLLFTGNGTKAVVMPIRP